MQGDELAGDLYKQRVCEQPLLPIPQLRRDGIILLSLYSSHSTWG